MRQRAAELSFDNVDVLDGLLRAIPLPADTADALLSCQAIGWELQEELPEIERVMKPGGIAVHLFGPIVPPGRTRSFSYWRTTVTTQISTSGGSSASAGIGSASGLGPDPTPRKLSERVDRRWREKLEAGASVS
jgi:ubiquinone/menaquinone biosynthesis C-methylase UbiE